MKSETYPDWVWQPVQPTPGRCVYLAHWQVQRVRA